MTDSYTYTPYGELQEHIGDSNNSFLYTGEQYDKETQNYYLRARYYSPTNARFLQRDTYDGTIAEPITQNHYAYANSNPSMYVDPSGFMSMLEITMSINISNNMNKVNAAIVQRAIMKELGCDIVIVGVEEIVKNGLYVLFANGFNYVGQSVNTKRRISQHKYAGKIANAAVDWSNRIGLSGLEGRKNKRLRETVERIVLEAFEEISPTSNVVKKPIGDESEFKKLKKTLKKMCKGK
jgi:RHS repeat-associated protein